VNEHQRDPVATTDVVVGQPYPVDVELRHGCCVLPSRRGQQSQPPVP
jgi:hypothetical protein